MTSFLEVIAHNDNDAALARRQASLVARQRVSSRVVKFLASGDLAERLAFAEDEIRAIAATAAEEFGVDPLPVADAVMDSLQPVATKTASTDHESARKPRMCPFHKDVVDISLAQGEAQAGFNAMSQHWGGPKHCEGEGYEGESCKFKPAMTTQSWWDERKEKAEQKRNERAEQAELEAVETETSLEDAPEDAAVPEATEIPETEGAEVIPFPFTDSAPAAEQASDVPMAMAASADPKVGAYNLAPGDRVSLFQDQGRQGTVVEPFGSWYRVKWDDGKVDLHLPAELEGPLGAQQAGGQVQALPQQVPAPLQQAASVRTATPTTGLGGPEPKIDKRKWTPKTVTEIDADDPNGRWPTKRKDIVEPIVASDADGLSEIGEKTTERQDVTKKVDDITGDGTSQWTGTKGQASPVTSALNDVEQNPIISLMNGDEDGFVPEHLVHRAIVAHKRKS